MGGDLSFVELWIYTCFSPITCVCGACYSLLVELRCQVHTELARCEEDVEQINVALDHIKKVNTL